MSFYALVPFENEIYLIRAEESKPLDKDQLNRVDQAMKGGKTLSDIQETLEDVWAK